MGASHNHFNHIEFKHEMTMSVFFYIYNKILLWGIWKLTIKKVGSCLSKWNLVLFQMLDQK